MRTSLPASLFAAIILVSAVGWAQQDMGVITGVVTDVTGAVVPGARVVVTNQDTNESVEVLTGETGAYTLGPLRVGKYDVSVEKTGFRKAAWKGIVLHTQDRARADFKMEVGDLAEAISVTSDPVLLQSESSSLAQVIQRREIQELPLNGRSFQKLAWLSAGVQPATRSRDRESGFNSHGQTFGQNNFLVDGVDNSSHSMGVQDLRMQATVPALDSVAEFKVQTSNYSAEFGRNSGALMMVSIRSGTNRLHGSAYEYLRNDVFDSRDAFNYVDRNQDGKADPEVLRQNQFGATLGGPVRRDRTFFFAGWERRRERRAQSDLGVTPTSDERNGLFPASLRVIRDPVTTQPFPGNQIPRNRIDTTAARLLELWPLPNFSGSGTRSNYISNPPWTVDRDQVDTRVDHNLSSYDRMFVRFSLTRFQQIRDSTFPSPARGSTDAFRNDTSVPVRGVAASYIHVFKPTVLYEFRYGLNRLISTWAELSKEPMDELLKKYEIRGYPPDNRMRGLPRFAFAGAIGYTGLGEPDSTPNVKVSQVHQFVNQLSWNRGNHSLRFGSDIRYNRSDAEIGTNTHGNFTFDGQFTNISFADFLLGYAGSASLSTWLNAQMRFRDFMFYLQDDWKLTRRFTLNLGLRYELDTPWYEKHNNMNSLDLASGQTFGRMVTAGHCGDSYSCRALVNLDTNNWAPRLGAAYQLSPRIVIRAAAGVFYGGQGAYGANGRGVANFPFSTNVTLTSTPTRPAVQLRDGFPPTLFGDLTTPPANANWRVWQPNFPLPTVYQWNLACQWALLPDTPLTVAYVGSSSNYILGVYNWNGSEVGPPATETQRRRIPRWNAINLVSPVGHSSYHGLDLQLEKRYGAGLSYTFGYTWSHSIDNVPETLGTAGGSIQDFRNISASRGNSAFDYRHRYVAALVYELPFARGKRFLGGWQLSGIAAGSTGHYFNVSLSNARQRLGASGVGDWRADRTGDGTLSTRTADRWFDTAAFALPRDASGALRLGNSGRNVLNSDGLFNTDVGIAKTFAITERLNLQFRAEAFNVTNTPTLGDPNANLESPDFGKVRSTVSTPRQFQFALRLSF